MTEITLEKLISNEDEYILTNWLVEEGSLVNVGMPIAEFETSKAAIEITSEADGKITFFFKKGDTIKFGSTICFIGNGEPPKKTESKNIKKNLDETTSVEKPLTKGFKIDKNRKKDFDANFFDGFKDNNKKENLLISNNEFKRANPRKNAEIVNLSKVNSTGLVSTIIKSFNHHKRKDNIIGTFESNLSDLIIFETAKLIKKFPKINSWFDPENGILFHDSVKFGYTVDIDDDLIVYNIGECSDLLPEDIRNNILGAIESHVIKKATKIQMEKSSITITDLSSSSIDIFLPLVNADQSLILGYSKTEDNKGYLSVAFDHRVLSGLYVSNFLNELIQNLNTQLIYTDKNLFKNECYYCAKDSIDSFDNYKERGFLKIIDSEGYERLCCRNCFEGW